MNLKVLLPFEVFVEETDVAHIVAETPDGAFGLLPQRLDCVAALTAGILSYRNRADEDIYVAVDGGVLIKTGADVFVSARRATRGGDLASLRDTVERQFLMVDAREQSVRSVMAKLEMGFLHRFASLQHD